MSVNFTTSRLVEFSHQPIGIDSGDVLELAGELWVHHTADQVCFVMQEVVDSLLHQ